MGDLKKKRVNADYIIYDSNGIAQYYIENKENEEKDKMDLLLDFITAYFDIKSGTCIEEKSKSKRNIGQASIRYRKYKNGIVGHRYKGYYIIKGEEKGAYQIIEEDRTVFKDNLWDYDECEWLLDKATATNEKLTMMSQLYDMKIYQLSTVMLKMMQKEEESGLNKKEVTLYRMIEKIRKRKAEKRPF